MICSVTLPKTKCSNLVQVSKSERESIDGRRSASSTIVRSTPRNELMKTKRLGMNPKKARIMDRFTLVRRRQVGFLVAFASLALMLATPVAAQVESGSLLTPEKASPLHAVATPRRTRPVEVEILRNGKSSESVSFANEAAANNDGARKSQAHHEAASDGAAADAGASSKVAGAPESAPDHRDMVAPPLNISIAPASAPAGGSFNAPADRVPTSKTINIP